MPKVNEGEIATLQIARREASALGLLVFSDAGSDQHPLPTEGEIVIGRSSKCNVVVLDPSMSREHVKITLGAQCFVEDLGSANGTSISGVKLAPNMRVPFAPGAVIEAGTVVLMLRAVSSAETAPKSVRADTSAATNARVLERFAKSGLTVLIQGETGAGKEVMAERIHRLSPRAEHPFVRLNCAAFSESLLESELFGHERGAFTGATAQKPGLIETAEGGTVLLDEIGDLSLALQVKLLRVLEEKKVWRVGALAARSVDVRFLAATHHDLESAVEKGTFRQDLFFRLNAITVRVPPLRERKSEIESLVRGFIAESCETAKRAPMQLGKDALVALIAHDWPGNVRELRNVIARAVALCEGDVLGSSSLELRRAESLAEKTPALGGALKDDVEALERKRIVDALAECGGNRSKAAKKLGIARNTLASRIARFGLDPKSS